MRINKTLKLSFIYSLPFVILIPLLIFINVLIKDFEYGHKSFSQQSRSINWLGYYIELNYNKVLNLFFYKKNDGLKKVKFIVPEKSNLNLLSNIPSSTKKWAPAYWINKNKVQEVELRYFGDNPFNFMFHQKNIRIKTKKRESETLKRYYEYKVSQGYVLNDFVAINIAKKLNILAPEVNLIELFVNGTSAGISIERERINENFLRRNKIMPVNIYKGENYNNERRIGLNPDLFNNPKLWSKISYFNNMEEEDFSDLKNTLEEIYPSPINFENGNFFDEDLIDYWSRLSVLQILNQTPIANSYHNSRLALDPWSGMKYLIPHDIQYNEKIIDKNNIMLHENNNQFFTNLNLISEFLDKKYSNLKYYLNKNDVLLKQVNELEKIKKKFLINDKYNLGKIQKKYYENDYQNNGAEKYEKFLDSLILRKKNLQKILSTKSTVSWSEEDDGFYLHISGNNPINNLEINLQNIDSEWIALDYNNNSKLDKHDYYFYKNKDENIFIPATFFANRQLTSKKYYNILDNLKIEVIDTKFKFFVDKNSMPNSFFVNNKFNDEKFEITKEYKKSSIPNEFNKPIIQSVKFKKTILQGNLTFKEDKIFSNPVEILQGTRIMLAPEVSILFKNKVFANGTKENPIVIKKIDNKQDPWGTFAVFGKKSNFSKLSNLVLSGGSGDVINDLKFYSMLSLHKTENIILNNLNLSNNFKFDDMVHIIYCDNITFKNSKLKNSFFDAIDVDISKRIKLENLKIENSGNDAIDSMESNLRIYNNEIINSKDKGVSSGENSFTEILNSLFQNNNIAIASKDMSSVKVSNTIFKQNKIHLNSYKKNWRYNSSGKINSINSTFDGDDKNFSSEENGMIKISGNNNIKFISVTN
jgi:hypothetical protein